MNLNKRVSARDKRKVRVRKKVSGTAARPRLSVFRSARHCYAQVIDDVAGVTLLSTSTVLKDYDRSSSTKMVQAEEIGKNLAHLCQQHQIDTVVFDRNGYRYHGRVKAVAEAARSFGLKF